MDCLPYTSTDEHLAALDVVINLYRSNDKRMRYRTFRHGDSAAPAPCAATGRGVRSPMSGVAPS